MSDNRPVGIVRNKGFELLKDAGCYLLGALFYAISVDVFTSPNNIVPGGITGISTVLHAFYDLPIGTMMLVLNIPIFIAGLAVIGWKYVARTGICLALVSATIDLLAPVLPQYTDDKVIASVFGGLCMGFGLSMIFMRGGSTGGTDVVARIFGRMFPSMTQGKLIVLIDIVIITGASVAFGKEGGSVEAGLNAALYAVISLFVSSFALDRVLYGMNTGCQLFIITAYPDEVNRGIIEKVNRGTTILSGRGGYSGSQRDIIMCAVRNSEVYQVRSVVRSIDRNAFIIVGNASSILGEGFQSNHKNEFGEIEDDVASAEVTDDQVSAE
ncbi:MAG: YitT family protein [Ruminococcaceae bacterium]|nr:YitT family protein [Oscillospiraceae bacterium]